MSRIIYMGTPDYARRILDAIYTPDHEWLVVTKPDMPVGRKQVLTPSAVASWAKEHGVVVQKPTRLKDFRENWERFRPDFILTAAYGRILPGWALAIPRFGSYNLHASLLPRWRGANPIAWAILSGEVTTGVTLMAMDDGIDTGPVVAQRDIPIGAHDTTGSLTERLAMVAAEVWLEEVRRYGESVWPSKPQSALGVQMAPKFDREAGHIRWNQDARAIDAQVRSMTPEPGAYTMLGDQRIKVLSLRVDEQDRAGHPPGLAVLKDGVWQVAVQSGVVTVDVIHPAGRRPMSPADFVRGRRGETAWQLS